MEKVRQLPKTMSKPLGGVELTDGSEGGERTSLKEAESGTFGAFLEKERFTSSGRVTKEKARERGRPDPAGRDGAGEGKSGRDCRSFVRHSWSKEPCPVGPWDMRGLRPL